MIEPQQDIKKFTDAFDYATNSKEQDTALQNLFLTILDAKELTPADKRYIREIMLKCYFPGQPKVKKRLAGLVVRVLGRNYRNETIRSLRILAGGEIIALHDLHTRGVSMTSVYAPTTVNAFRKILAKGYNPKIRSSVAIGLGDMAYTILRHKVEPLLDTAIIAERALISTLRDDSPKVRRAVAKALRKIGTPEALTALPPRPWWKFW